MWRVAPGPALLQGPVLLSMHSLAAFWPLLAPEPTQTLPTLAAGVLVPIQLQRDGVASMRPASSSPLGSVLPDLSLRAWRAGEAERTAQQWATLLGWTVTPQEPEAGGVAAWLVADPAGTGPQLLLFDAPDLKRDQLQTLGSLYHVGDLGLSEASVRSVFGPAMLEAPSCFVSCAGRYLSRIVPPNGLPILLEQQRAGVAGTASPSADADLDVSPLYRAA